MLAEELSQSTESTVATVAQQYSYKPKSRVIKQDADFEKLEVKKYFDFNYSFYEAKEIDRSYSINNPFDLEDLNNPFNLPRAGSNIKRNTKKKSSEDLSVFFSSLFEYEQLSKKTITNKNPGIVPPYWLFFTLLGLLSLFAYQTVVFKNDNKKAIHAFLSNTAALQQHRDQKIILTPYQILSESLFILSAGHFVFIGTRFYLHNLGLEYSWGISALLFSLVGVAAFTQLKNLQFRLIGLIFPLNQQLAYYNFILSNSYKILALSTTPLLFLLTYSPETIKYFAFYAGILIFSASLVYSYFRMAIASSEIILENKFHFFIYLCAVELAPILILLKFLSVI
jgi:hypothetical protein